MITLDKLFNDSTLPSINLKDIMDDSRKKVEQSIFFSLQGLTHDGHQFINQAISNGAIVIVHTRELKNKKEGITYIQRSDLSAEYPELVNRFYDYPSSKLKLVGITGTNGKTTTAILTQYLLSAKMKSAYMGTLGIFYNDMILDQKLTTNTLVENQKLLNDMVNHGIEVCVMEASSQGIDMGRVHGLTYDSAIFTNLSQDHLDYHLNMESYYQAKKKLFTSTDISSKVVINIDDEYGVRLANELVNPIISVSLKDARADYFVDELNLGLYESTFILQVENEVYRLQTNLLGEYNITNCVQAMAIAHHYGVSFEQMSEMIKETPDVTGRLQSIDSEYGFKVIIDFAHSPDSMEKILSFARSTMQQEGRIISVFGSAGKRDKSKRKPMGEMADKYSDLIYITEDDPRDEAVLDIANEIALGVFNKPYVIIESRIMAIHLAIASAQKGDIIIIMGKGNETTIAIGNQDLPYPTDYQVALDAIEELRKDHYESNQQDY